MKTIVCFISSLKLGGGAERVMSNLANQFSKNGCRVYVITTYKADKEYPLALEIERFTILQEKKHYNFIQRNIIQLKYLRNFCKKKEIDVCLAFMPESNLRALISTIGLNIRVYVSERCDPKILYPTLLKKKLIRFLYGYAAGIIFQTEEARDFFASKKIKAHSTVIINSIDDKFLHNKYNGLRQHIVTAGRLVNYKNHQMLIKAFDRVKDVVPNDNLIIYGEGSERENLERLVHDLNLDNRVFLPGNKDNILTYLEKAKLFVLPSDFEGMPNALMEAMALGVPSISTDCPCGGSRYLIHSNDCGRLVKVNDKINLADCMKELLTNSEELKKISENSVIRMQEFKEENVVEKWMEFLDV